MTQYITLYNVVVGYLSRSTSDAGHKARRGWAESTSRDVYMCIGHDMYVQVARVESDSFHTRAEFRLVLANIVPQSTQGQIIMYTCEPCELTLSCSSC